MPSVRIVGPGRAGSSLAGALRASGWAVLPPVRRGGDPSAAAAGVDLCVVATPDDAIATVADAIDPVPTSVVAHLSGSLGLSVLGRHQRTASLHPLASLPDEPTGTATLLAGVWWAVEGDALAADAVRAMGGRVIPVPQGSKPAYHAAACIAANHVVVLMAQVERIVASAGLPVGPFYDLAGSALANAGAKGAAAALTGPAARGDLGTLQRHRSALDPAERALYDALATAGAEVARCR